MCADKLKPPNSTAIYAFLMTKKCHFLQPKNPDTDRRRRKKESKKKNWGLANALNGTRGHFQNERYIIFICLQKIYCRVPFRALLRPQFLKIALFHFFLPNSPSVTGFLAAAHFLSLQNIVGQGSFEVETDFAVCSNNTGKRSFPNQFIDFLAFWFSLPISGWRIFGPIFRTSNRLYYMRKVVCDVTAKSG